MMTEEQAATGAAEVATEARATPAETPMIGSSVNPPMPAFQNKRRGLPMETFEQIWRFSTAVFSSGLVPKGCKSINDCFLIICAGQEIGLDAMAALDSMYIVNGHAKVFGDGMWSLCRPAQVFNEAMYDEHFEGTFPGDDFRAVCTLGRNEKGARPHTREFSVGDAKRGGLLGGAQGKDTYNKWLKDMLIRRARSRCCSDTFPDLLKGRGSAETREEVDELIAQFDLADAPECAAMTPAERMVDKAKAIGAATAGQDFPVAQKSPTDTPPVLKEPDVPTEAIAETSAPVQASTDPEPTTPHLEDEKHLTATRKKLLALYKGMKPDVAKECLKNAGLDRIMQIGDLNGSDLQAVLDVAISLT